MVAQIPLTNSPGEYFTVDEKNVKRFSHYRWYKHRNGYPVRYVKGRGTRFFRVLYVHRLVMGVSPRQYRGYVVDHIDGNPLNNVEANLRVVSQKENCRNRRKIHRESRTSQFKGVYLDKGVRGRKRYKAQICLEGRTTHIGRYEQEEDAARAYDLQALTNWGTICYTNFPVEQYLDQLVAA